MKDSYSFESDDVFLETLGTDVYEVAEINETLHSLVDLLQKLDNRDFDSIAIVFIDENNKRTWFWPTPTVNSKHALADHLSRSIKATKDSLMEELLFGLTTLGEMAEARNVEIKKEDKNA